ncbi:MAG: UbiA family prenyltransferase [Promethearchaeota archaeon]
MSNRIGLLRLDYTFSVIIPMLIAIYLNRLNPFRHIDILIGFVFLAITGNTWNDVIDMKDPTEVETLKRVEGYHPREIFTIGFISFFLGITLLLRTCIQHFINAVFLVIIIISVLIYCKWIKPIPFVNHLLLGVSHMLLPYFMIKVDAGLPLLDFENEGPLVFAFIAFALTGQFVHEVIDGDALVKRFSLRTCQLLIWIFSIISLILAIWAFVIIPHFYFIPFVFFPIGTMYTFRRPTKSTQGVKDVGILIGNFILVYFICLIILQMERVI